MHCTQVTVVATLLDLQKDRECRGTLSVQCNCCRKGCFRPKRVVLLCAVSMSRLAHDHATNMPQRGTSRTSLSDEWLT